MTDRKTGIVKWFNLQKGFGFITPDAGGPDVFVNHTAIPEGTKLYENQRVSYDEVPGPKGPNAEKVTAQ